MQIITMALVCLLLAGMWPQDVDSQSMHVSFSRCCFSFVRKKISLGAIQCYRNTSSSCPHRGFIFKLKRGKEACALKTDKWAQKYGEKLSYCPPERK
ncbi:C-C motif chemokine 1 [Saimiri boliviensis]|uniref:C-C motif chemokine 1 n=1 Tax=Saimiri boliviensis boliviensis TaxID=39432 RepID=A0A2K6S6D0_SAIBB|nr:C-C motif chemokine 1 [Saimiri boliviensis boliviensis]